MKVRVRATGEIVVVQRVIDDNFNSTYYSPVKFDDERTWEPHEVEVLPSEPKEVREGWISRDKDGDLHFSENEPLRNPKYDFWAKLYKVIELPYEFFPNITWDSKPKKVKLTIEPEET